MQRKYLSFNCSIHVSKEDLIAFIPKAKAENEEKKAIADGKIEDKSPDFHTTKV